MKIVGCDLHTRYQQIAMLHDETGELMERRLETRQRRSKTVLQQADGRMAHPLYINETPETVRLPCYDHRMSTNLLTINEAMQALGVSRSTLWRRLQRGELASVRRDGRRLVRLTSLRKAAGGKKKCDLAPFTESHPIFRLVGAGRSGGRVPGAREKHAILDA